MVFPDSNHLLRGNVTEAKPVSPLASTFPAGAGASTHCVVATAGEALMDMLVEADGRLLPCAGGAVYNLTRALGLQGVGTLYLNPLSGDRFGQALKTALHRAHVSLAHPNPVQMPTSLAIVGLDEAGKASYSFYRDGVADRQVSCQILNAACSAHATLQIVATGCLALVPDDTTHYLPWLQAQRAAGKLVVVDANLRPAIVPDMAAYRQSVMAALRHAHVIKVSDDDLVTLGYGGNSPTNGACQLLADTSAHTLALTLGAQGAVLMTRNGQLWHAGETTPVNVADTVGAGDCFLAGMLVALLERPLTLSAILNNGTTLAESDVHHVLQTAVASATLCVTQTGCAPPTRTQVANRVGHLPATVVAQKVPGM